MITANFRRPWGGTILKPSQKRLPRDRFSDSAQPKPLRIIDKAALERARARGHCEICGKPLVRAQACHLISRKSGGDDTDENLYSACVECHRLEHHAQIPKAQIKTLIARRQAARSGQIVRRRTLCSAASA